MDFLRRRSNTGIPEHLQVMSPTAPSGENPGPQANDGEGVEGHQDLVPAMSAGPMGPNDQQNQGLANGVSPPERVGTGQSYGRSQALAASSQDQVPIQGAGLDLVPTGVGEHHAQQAPQPVKRMEQRIRPSGLCKLVLRPPRLCNKPKQVCDKGFNGLGR